MIFGTSAAGGSLTVKRNRRREIGAHSHCQVVGDAAAEAEAGDANLAVTIRTILQPDRRCKKVFLHLGAVDRAEQAAALLVVTRIAAHRSQSIGSKRIEALKSQPPPDVFDVRIQSAVLVNDENARQLCRSQPQKPDARIVL